MLPVTDEEILAAESILLPAGCHFDEERRAFIRNFGTCDLQAVPGSGKTTVLLAKLLIFEKRMPIENGKGIVALSHTNIAVDEINHKLRGHCTKIFAYPNFVGTIQSFVNEFLAVPYYTQMFKHKPNRIDNEIYDEKIARYALPVGANTWLRNRDDAEDFKKGIRFAPDGSLTYRGNNLPVGAATPTYQAFLQMKKRLLERGYLHYDDAYFLAEKYLSNVPNVVALLRKRFDFAFVDEMQDMEAHQYNLLERIFFSNGNSPIYQRIGDKNQSIYSGIASTGINWAIRDVLLQLRGSHRLSANIARTIQPFGVFSDTPIIGHFASDLQPHLFVFNDGEHLKVLPRFARLIREYQNAGQLPQEFKHPIKAIGWVSKQGDGNDLYLPHYFPAFNKENKAAKIDYANLLSYLVFYDKKAKTFDGIRQNIINGILKVLRLENILNGTKDFTKTTFLNILKLSNRSLFDDFNLNLYRCCLEVLQGRIHLAHQHIRDYLPEFLMQWRALEFSDIARDFINSNIEDDEVVFHVPRQNMYTDQGINIEVDTVHSVKGQTHSATLYVETRYYSYESQKCMNQLLGISATGPLGIRQREAAKMMYVGLSRATHLLGLAVSRDRLGDRQAQLEELGWIIIDCSEN